MREQLNSNANLSDWEIRYGGVSEYLVFMSQFGAVANTVTGYVEQLERIAQAVPAANFDPFAMPRLRPVSSLKRVYDAKTAILKGIDISVFDAVNIGSPEQDAATHTAIQNARAGENALVESAYLNSISVDWEPSFLRPRIIADGKVILGGLQQSEADEGTNKADMGIGIGHHSCISAFAMLGRVQSLQVYAHCAQYIPESLTFQLYPVRVILHLSLFHNLDVSALDR